LNVLYSAPPNHTSKFPPPARPLQHFPHSPSRLFPLFLTTSLLFFPVYDFPLACSFQLTVVPRFGVPRRSSRVRFPFICRFCATSFLYTYPCFTFPPHPTHSHSTFLFGASSSAQSLEERPHALSVDFSPFPLSDHRVPGSTMVDFSPFSAPSWPRLPGCVSFCICSPWHSSSFPEYIFRRKHLSVPCPPSTPPLRSTGKRIPVSWFTLGALFFPTCFLDTPLWLTRRLRPVFCLCHVRVSSS